MIALVTSVPQTLMLDFLMHVYVPLSGCLKGTLVTAVSNSLMYRLDVLEKICSSYSFIITHIATFIFRLQVFSLLQTSLLTLVALH